MHALRKFSPCSLSVELSLTCVDAKRGREPRKRENRDPGNRRASLSAEGSPGVCGGQSRGQAQGAECSAMRRTGKASDVIRLESDLRANTTYRYVKAMMDTWGKIKLRHIENCKW